MSEDIKRFMNLAGFDVIFYHALGKFSNPHVTFNLSIALVYSLQNPRILKWFTYRDNWVPAFAASAINNYKDRFFNSLEEEINYFYSKRDTPANLRDAWIISLREHKHDLLNKYPKIGIIY